MKGIHHPKDNVHCLYLYISKDMRRLTGVENTLECECTGLVAYVIKRTGTLTQIVCNTPTPIQTFLLKFVSSAKFTIPELTGNNHHHFLKEKPLH
eukprot:9816071-Ditylum_brightwellii.AAC.1